MARFCYFLTQSDQQFPPVWSVYANYHIVVMWFKFSPLNNNFPNDQTNSILYPHVSIQKKTVHLSLSQTVTHRGETELMSCPATVNFFTYACEIVFELLTAK